MSASMLCLACHRLVQRPTDRCAACGAQMGSRKPGPQAGRAYSLAMLPGLDGLAAAQESSGAYWFLARGDYQRLEALLDAWPVEDDPVRRLLAAKRHRGIVCDPDQLPGDVVRIGARVAVRTGSQVETCAITDPGDTADLRDAVPVTSPLGALLLGLIEGRALRGLGPDGAAIAIVAESVRCSKPASAPGAAAVRTLAGVASPV